jgi:ribonuclease HII
MCKLHEEYPMYNWKQNKGYPTKEHREAIKKYGITKYHRKTFRLFPEQLQLDI